MAGLSKYGGRWLATTTMCVEGKGESKVGCGGENGLSVLERDIPKKETTNIIVKILNENYNTSKLSIFLRIAEHFLLSRTTLIDDMLV